VADTRAAGHMFHHDLHSLRLFVAICERRSLSRAAEKLNMAVSAASRRLRLLEEEAGTKLVRRLPHGVELTQAGVVAERYAQSVLRLADQFAANMDEQRDGTRGRIRVVASSSALVHRLAADLAGFARDHPDIKIDLEERPTTETLLALERKQADLGVIVRGVVVHGFDTHPYAQDRLAVAVPPGHRLVGRQQVRFAELLGEEFVSLDTGTAVYRLTVGKAREAGQVMKIRVQVRSFEVMCQMVLHGLGVGILPEMALRPLAESLGLHLVGIEEDWALRDLDVIVPSDTPLDLSTALLLARLRQSGFV